MDMYEELMTESKECPFCEGRNATHQVVVIRKGQRPIKYIHCNQNKCKERAICSARLKPFTSCKVEVKWLR